MDKMDTADKKDKQDRHVSTKQLEALFGIATKKMVSFVSSEDFSEAYKKIFVNYKVKDGEERLLNGSSREGQKLHENFNVKVVGDLEDTFENFLEEQNIDKKLRELEHLISLSSSSQGKAAWRPPGNVKKHMEKFNLVSKMEQKAELEAVVAKEREQLEVLKKKVLDKRAKVLELNNILEGNQKKMENAIADLTLARDAQ